MIQKNKKDMHDPEEKERQRVIDSINREYEKSLAVHSPTWEQLNRAAAIAMQGVNRNLSHKEYRRCGMWLKLWSDIWQYAYEHLDISDYQRFCQFQCEPAGDRVM